MGHAYIIDAVRTPRGRGKAGKGGLSGIHPQQLLSQCLERLAARTGITKGDVDDVIAGVVSEAGDQGANPARNSVLASDWPWETTGVTLNRFCGSGVQAVNFAAMGIGSGAQDLVIAGGVESMSRVPMGADGGGIDGNNMTLRKKVFQVPQGISADLIATLEGFKREDLDEVAFRSQQSAAAAIAEGRFGKGMFPVIDPETGKVALTADEHPRKDTTREGLGQLQPAFLAFGAMPAGPNGETLDQIALARYPQAGGSINHLHTAGNSSGIVDGAAALLLASEGYATSHGLKPRARIRAMATIGAEPLIMLTAPAPASKKALAKAGMTAKDIDLWEINEAFAAVVLQTVRALEIDMNKVNVNGGAIALGHPLGATGAMLLGTALDELERKNLNTALITMCIGGGMGIATIIERV